MKNYYKLEDGTKVKIDDREFIDGVPIVDNKDYLLMLRNILRTIKYNSKNTKEKVKNKIYKKK